MMKRIYYTYPVLLVWLVSTLLPQFCIAMPNEQKENNDVVIENAEMRLIISNDGKARTSNDDFLPVSSFTLTYLFIFF